ncbi:MAG: MFS transporter [Gaiellaceae bacterium]
MNVSTAAYATAERRVSKTGALLVASFGALLAFLDATIVNVAFPSIQSSFHGSSIESLSWVLNAYNIVFAAFLVVSGRLADLFGRRRMFTTGIVVFTVASLFCGVASSLAMLTAARVLQAAGAALLVPASLALVVQAFPAERRSHAVGLWGAAAALAAGLGPPLGGALVELYNWRLVFLINIPLGVLAVVLAGRYLVESRAPGRRTLPDLRGALLLAVAIALLTLGIVQGDSWGWTSWKVIGSLVGAAVAGGLFVVSSRRHPVPVLDPKLLRIRSFAVSNAVTFLAGMGFYAYLLNNILWLHYVWGWSLLLAGLAVAPGAFVAAAFAGRFGRLADRRGYRVVAVPGALVWALAYVWYASRVGTDPSFAGEWLPGQVLSGVGVAATLPILASAALAAVPGGRFATASSVVSSARQLGGVIGVAILVAIVGTPTAETIVTRLRHGWILCAACFVAAAAGSLLLRRERERVAEDDEAVLTPRVEVPARPARSGAGASGETLFHRLPEAARARLLASADTVTVAAGDWLFEAGGRADAVYVVEAGRLEVVVGSAVVNEVVPGEVVGELAVLADATRSAGIRARRDSRLLRIGADEFHAVLDVDPAAERAVRTALAVQLQQSRRIEEAVPSEPRVVAVLGSRAHWISSLLVESLARHLNVVAPGRVTIDALDRAERDAERVVLTATPDDDAEWHDFCKRQADRVVIVAASDEAPPQEHVSDARAYLVLVGAPPARASLVAWHDAVAPRRVYTCSANDLGAAVAPLAARLAGRSLGVALAGGGARAFASIGVLQELEENGFAVDRVSGCSVGGVIAAMYASGMTAAAVDAACYDEFVRRSPFGDLALPRVSLSRGRRAEASIARQIGDLHFEELPRQLALVSTDMLAHTAVVHRRGLVREALRASFSLPGLFPPARLNGSLHIDGGVLDNLPVRALDDDEGPIVAVNIAAGAGFSRRAGPPRMPTLPETMLRTMLMGSARELAAAREHATVVVTPDTRGIGLLEFHQIDRAVEAGRSAGRAALDALTALSR